jgi:hypothetical protein
MTPSAIPPDRRTTPLRDRIAYVAVLTAALTLLVVAPASAHPYIHGGELPVDSLATVTLDLAHGCDSEEEGAGGAGGLQKAPARQALSAVKPRGRTQQFLLVIHRVVSPRSQGRAALNQAGPSLSVAMSVSPCSAGRSS